MGQQIVYCAACGSKILARDFESKAAFRLDSRGFCKACAPDALKSLPPDKLAQVLSQISQAESSASRKSLPAAKPHAPSPVPAVRRQAPEPSRTPLIVAGVAVAAGILGTLLVMTASRPEPLPAPRPPPPVAPDRPAKPDREALAAQALQKARDYRDANPKDVATQIAGYERLASDFSGTRAGEEARRDLEELRRRRAQETLDAELKTLLEQAKGLAAAEEFQKAIQALTDARPRHPEPSWTQGIDATVADVRATSEKLFAEIKNGAIEARRRGGDATPAKERVARWGMPQYLADFEAALAAVPVSDKRPLINGKDLTGWEVFRGKWVVKDGMLEAIGIDEQSRTFISWAAELGDFDLEGSIQMTGKTYTEFHVRHDFSGNVHIDPGWHTFRVVARGSDVKVFVDDAPLNTPTGKGTRGRFGIFTIGDLPIRIKDVKIRP